MLYNCLKSGEFWFDSAYSYLFLKLLWVKLVKWTLFAEFVTRTAVNQTVKIHSFVWSQDIRKYPENN